MRPADLKPSFCWQDKKIYIEDSIFYVPDNTSAVDYQFPGWVHDHTFKLEQPVCIEFCSGNGDWIAEKAQKHTHLNWVAVDIKFSRIRKIWSKLKNHDLNNLFIVCGEGKRVSREYFPENSVDQVFVNFPDPWPKKRHWKHRIIEPDFVKEVGRLLKPGGTLMLVTDDEPYSEWMTKIMLKSTLFKPVYAAPYYSLDYPDYGSSYFESMWKDQGKEIRYHLYKKGVSHG